MQFKMVHLNFNVSNLARSLAFYDDALGLREKHRINAADGSFIIVYLSDGMSDFELELTELRDHPQPYDLGEGEFHLAFTTNNFHAMREKHRNMGVICLENHAMGIYFIEDPDGYWLEVLPAREEGVGEAL